MPPLVKKKFDISVFLPRLFCTWVRVFRFPRVVPPKSVICVVIFPGMCCVHFLCDWSVCFFSSIRSRADICWGMLIPLQEFLRSALSLTASRRGSSPFWVPWPRTPLPGPGESTKISARLYPKQYGACIYVYTCNIRLVIYYTIFISDQIFSSRIYAFLQKISRVPLVHSLQTLPCFPFRTWISWLLLFR